MAYPTTQPKRHTLAQGAPVRSLTTERWRIILNGVKDKAEAALRDPSKTQDMLLDIYKRAGTLSTELTQLK